MPHDDGKQPIGTPQTQAFDPDQTRAAIGLLSEVAASDGDARDRKTVLMDRVAEHIDADRWIWLVSRYRGDGSMMAVSLLQKGHTERDIALFMESATDPAAPVLEHGPMVELSRDGRHFTRRRHELVPDEQWYDAPSYKLYRKPMGLNEFLYSIRPLPGEMISGVGFHRKDGRPAFTEEHSRFVHLIFSATDALHTMDMPDTDGSDVMDLPPRVRTTFGLLIEGFSRKQIAEHLGVSPNTVAEYSSRVYKHFRVRGQRELMVRFRSADARQRTPRTTENHA